MKTRIRSIALLRRPLTTLRRAEGVELLEFALVLPILLVMVTGMLDFALAYNIKQKLSNAAREGARLAASQSPADLEGAGACVSTVPGSVQSVRDAVVTYLTQSNVDTSFIGTSGSSPSNCVWTYYSSASYGLRIERNFQLPATGGGIIGATRITVTYPYNWTFGFNRVITLMIPSATASGTIAIPADAIMQNLG
jgi:TadE-like protein